MDWIVIQLVGSCGHGHNSRRAAGCSQVIDPICCLAARDNKFLQIRRDLYSTRTVRGGAVRYWVYADEAIRYRIDRNDGVVGAIGEIHDSVCRIERSEIERARRRR